MNSEIWGDREVLLIACDAHALRMTLVSWRRSFHRAVVRWSLGLSHRVANRSLECRPPTRQERQEVTLERTLFGEIGIDIEPRGIGSNQILKSASSSSCSRALLNSSSRVRLPFDARAVGDLRSTLGANPLGEGWPSRCATTFGGASSSNDLDRPRASLDVEAMSSMSAIMRAAISSTVSFRAGAVAAARGLANGFLV